MPAETALASPLHYRVLTVETTFVALGAHQVQPLHFLDHSTVPVRVQRDDILPVLDNTNRQDTRLYLILYVHVMFPGARQDSIESETSFHNTRIHTSDAPVFVAPIVAVLRECVSSALHLSKEHLDPDARCKWTDSQWPV